MPPQSFAAEDTMKAVRIHAYGGPEVLMYEDAPRPTIADNEVLVRVHAAAINPIDRATRAGYLQGMVDFSLPLILGLGLSGVAEAGGQMVARGARGAAG